MWLWGLECSVPCVILWHFLAAHFCINILISTRLSETRQVDVIQFCLMVNQKHFIHIDTESYTLFNLIQHIVSITNWFGQEQRVDTDNSWKLRLGNHHKKQQKRGGKKVSFFFSCFVNISSFFLIFYFCQYRDIIKFLFGDEKVRLISE